MLHVAVGACMMKCIKRVCMHAWSCLWFENWCASPGHLHQLPLPRAAQPDSSASPAMPRLAGATPGSCGSTAEGGEITVPFTAEYACLQCD